MWKNRWLDTRPVDFKTVLYKERAKINLRRQNINRCSMADGISFDVSLSLNCTDFYKREGGA